MKRTLLGGKIHRATVTQADLNYVGSITIDRTLMELAGFREYEKVQVVNINNGNRLETYIIEGEANSGIICLNGAAARYFDIDDKVIIMGYLELSSREVKKHKPKVVFVDDVNRPTRVTHYEKHGMLA